MSARVLADRARLRKELEDLQSKFTSARAGYEILGRALSEEERNFTGDCAHVEKLLQHAINTTVGNHAPAGPAPTVVGVAVNPHSIKTHDGTVITCFENPRIGGLSKQLDLAYHVGHTVKLGGQLQGNTLYGAKIF